MTVNCKSVVNKVAELKAKLHYVKPDVVCGCESWLKSGTKSSEIFPEEYNVFRKDRITDTTGGGVFILVKKNIVCTEEPSLDSDC